MARTAISKRTRFEVFKRDGFACQYCGQHPPDIVLEVDHITPVAEGGRNDEDNLITACFGCNRGKAHVPLSVVPKSLASKAAEIEEREAQITGYREVIQARLARLEADMWDVADTLLENASTVGMKRADLLSIKTFLKRMDLHEVKEAAWIARARVPHSEGKRFKYFCGVCWKKIKEATDA